MRSRAVSLPLACTLSMAASPLGACAWAWRFRRSASFPAVVWISGAAAASGAFGSWTVVMDVSLTRVRGGLRRQVRLSLSCRLKLLTSTFSPSS